MSHPRKGLTTGRDLTRAWLNLLDKHMTTGRINQVLRHVIPAACEGTAKNTSSPWPHQVWVGLDR